MSGQAQGGQGPRGVQVPGDSTGVGTLSRGRCEAAEFHGAQKFTRQTPLVGLEAAQSEVRGDLEVKTRT